MNPIILIGRAECWESDLEEFKKLTSEFDVMAIGMDCLYKGNVKYFTTYHPKDIEEYIARRKSKGLNIDFLVISHTDRISKNQKTDKVNIFEPHKDPSGSSALLGAAAAIKLKYNKIILCGCPMSGRNPEGKQSYNHFQKGWEKRGEEIKPYVRSMSGWTKGFLGYPTKEWIEKGERDEKGN